jgi:hypothetical protein
VIGQWGLGTVSGSIARTVRDIEDLAGSPQGRERISCCARQYVTEFHSAPVVVAAFEHALQGVRAS